MSNEIINIKNKIEKPAEIKKGDFDFDYWSNLAKKDPEAFEAAREAEINKHISSLGDQDVQERMERLQWRIEMERKRAKNPLDAAGRIYDMMWESVGRNIEALDELAELLNPQTKAKAHERVQEESQSNNVVAFSHAGSGTVTD